MAQSENEMSTGVFIGFMAFFIATAIALLFWAFQEYSFTRRVLHHNILVRAKVIDLLQTSPAPTSQRQSGNNSTAPVLEFVYKQDTIWYSSEQYSTISDYSIGEEVEIYINPEKPKDSIINSWSEKWGAAAIIGVLGGIFFLLSAGSLLNSWMDRQQ